MIPVVSLMAVPNLFGSSISSMDMRGGAIPLIYIGISRFPRIVGPASFSSTAARRSRARPTSGLPVIVVNRLS